MNKTIAKQDDAYKNYILDKIVQFNNNDKPTVVHFVDTYYPIIDGVIKVVENYAMNLTNQFNVVLIVPTHKGETVVDKTDFLVIGAKSHYFKFVNYDLALPKSDKFLKKVFSLLKVDIIHGHSPFTIGGYASKLAKKLGVPFVMTLHSQYKQDFMRYTKSKLLTKILLKYIMRVFNKSTEVWTMHKLTEQVIREYGYKGRVHLVPNATDFYVSDIPFTNDQLRDMINTKYGIDNNIPTFLFVGRIIAQKNIHFLVDALSILDKKGLDFKMFFVGNGPDENALKKQIKNKNLENKIILAGRIDDKIELTSYYARSDLFLFPSVYDASSLVQIEASALYTPSVLLANTATAQTVTHGVNAFVSENSVDKYADMVFNAIKDKKSLKIISKNAHDQLYVTWKDLSEKITERYYKLLTENKLKEQ